MKDMKEFNLYRLIEASPFSNQLSDWWTDALVDFLIDVDAKLENINIDNIIANSLMFFKNEEELKKDGRNLEDEDILYQDEDEIIIWLQKNIF